MLASIAGAPRSERISAVLSNAQRASSCVASSSVVAAAGRSLLGRHEHARERESTRASRNGADDATPATRSREAERQPPMPMPPTEQSAVDDVAFFTMTVLEPSITPSDMRATSRMYGVRSLTEPITLSRASSVSG